ncbi:PREDICTED: cyclic nucleotide-gated ion channel 1-like [Prunus mume]|uniref:Cyclic nucleotide-gated ion channel 1-like n=1 Tax=Prunus mume TaxID=102107 RepID=A0ABM0P5S5_PRUMU|nr:PREDICTED: cyclic nucleotide-gated ion channel 1-like [Prunus mume]
MEVEIPRVQGCDLEENAEEKVPTSNANGIYCSGKSFPAVDLVADKLHKLLGHGFEWIMIIREALKSCYGVLAFGMGFKNKFVNPQELVLLQRWNKILQVLCVVSLSLDPLFCYLLIVNDENKCLRLDTRLGNIAILLRSVIDFFHLFRIIFQFRASITIITPSQASGTGRNESVPEPPALVGIYLLLWFLLDILVILPLPQVVVIFIIPRLNDSRVFNATKSLNFIVILQYVLRVLRISSWLKKATRTSGILAETAGAKAAFNLFLYMLASHVVGAFWYLFSIERKTACWRQVCKNHAGSEYCSLYCGDDTFGATTLLNDSCSAKTPNSTLFDFGIYSDALKSGVINSADFVQKISYCFWWGLQNLSSLGQSLKTSTYVWEIYFSVVISISGLVLFAFLIGNMQTYLQSKTARLEEMRLKGQEIELWMAFHSLPRKLKKRIRQYEKYKWQETRGVDVENFLHNLPRDLRRDTKRHLCSGPLSKVPVLQNMNKRLLDAICELLKPVLYIEHSFIFRKEDPLDEMLFITRGKVLAYSSSTCGEGANYLEKGDFYGEELLDWVLKTCPAPALSNLPISTKTVRAETKVELFALKANDLKHVVSKFWWLFSKELRNSNSFGLQQWQPRAACVLQTAWRHHKREKLQKSPRLAQEGSHSAADHPAVSETQHK